MVSSAVQRYMGVDLNVYIPALIILGGAIAGWQYFSDFIWRQTEAYFMSTVEIRIDDEIYNMLMAWVAEQRFAKGARRFVANTNLNSRSWFLWRRSDDDDEDEEEGDEGDTHTHMALIGGKKKKALAYTPTFGSHYFFYKGRLCIFRRDRGREQAGGFLLTSEKEEISVSCFGRNPQALKELLHEARVQFMKRDEAKTLIYRGNVRAGSTEPTWQRMMARVSRPFSTVILNEKVKQDLIDDVTDYLNPATRRWYSNRGIPYRRGYLLYGPPGTGKSSLSLALAGFFKMRIYIVSLSSLSSTEENLASLFSELPRRCVVLLEDIDTAGLTHTREEDGMQSNQVANDSEANTPKQGLRGKEQANNNNNNSFRLSLSGLLNILDGVASQEGRVLIMTTNHLEKLDKALIRPGRVDMIVEFGNADQDMTAAIFRAIFAPLEADVSPVALKPTLTDVQIATSGDSSAEHEAALKKAAAAEAARDEMVSKVQRLAEAFAAKIPAHEFSPAELQGFLMKHKRSPEAAIAGAEAWTVETRKEKAASKVKEAEEKRKKEEEAKKKKEEAEKREKKKKSKTKSKSNKEAEKKKGRVSSTESESEASASERDSASEDSESDSKIKRAKKSKKSKTSKRKQEKVSDTGTDKSADVKVVVDEASSEEISREVEPKSAVTEKSDGFVDVETDECGDESNQPKTRGSDSGYSTP